MQLSSRILTALAVLILAVAVVAVRGGSSGTVEAATGTIDVLNVGTCYTTNSDAFAVGDCKDGDATEGYNVAGRDAITEVDAGSSIYATYANDPKSSGNVPRAILNNSDVIQISINDKDRDRRTGVLYPVGTAGTQPTPDDGDAANGVEQEGVINSELGDLVADLSKNATTGDTEVTSATGGFSVSQGNAAATITSSGIYRLNLNESTHPMAPRGDGKIVWFGSVDNTDDTLDVAFGDLENYISLDEDLFSGTRGQIAPWMRVTASVPANATITINFIYYQTSQREILAGGRKKANYIGYTDTENTPPNNVEIEQGLGTFEPVFFDNENNNKPGDQAALVLGAGSDGEQIEQNLWLKETDDFTGVYEGFLRLTDADGAGLCDHDGEADTDPKRCNWGLDVRDAESGMMEGAAYLGVESGPVTIRYKNSNGDVRTSTVLIDKDPPAIQIDSPMHNTSSKDDSPDLLGSFSDGGGSNLRGNSFRVYADNRSDDSNDDKPIWDFRVDGGRDGNPYGYVCVDADDDAAGECDDPLGTAALRGHYAGYMEPNPEQDNSETFGIIKGMDVYLSTEAVNSVTGARNYKAQTAEDYEDGDDSGVFDTVIRIDFPPTRSDNRYNNTIDIQAVVLDIAGNFGFSDSQPSDPTFIHDFGTATTDDRDDSDVHNVLGWYSRHQYRLDDVDPEYSAKESATGFFTDENGKQTRSNSGVKVVFDNDVDASSIGIGTFVVKLDSGESATITAAPDSTKTSTVKARAS
ncbi:MAG: hypothetical protein F4180_08475 [Chloroflexi bacterium]|nr:hypothetical protein [Chloroflexota bacterium]